TRWPATAFASAPRRPAARWGCTRRTTCARCSSFPKRPLSGGGGTGAGGGEQTGAGGMEINSFPSRGAAPPLPAARFRVCWDTVTELRKRGIKIGTTTGYFRQAAEVVFAEARAQGYEPDLNVLPDDVPAGRPYPWMIFRLMEELEVYPPAAVVKIGDTIHDIYEGLNAGAWRVGVLQSG